MAPRIVGVGEARRNRRRCLRRRGAPPAIYSRGGLLGLALEVRLEPLDREELAELLLDPPLDRGELDTEPPRDEPLLPEDTEPRLLLPLEGEDETLPEPDPDGGEAWGATCCERMRSMICRITGELVSPLAPSP
jgi:hypothetical protein